MTLFTDLTHIFVKLGDFHFIFGSFGQIINKRKLINKRETVRFKNFVNHFIVGNSYLCKSIVLVLFSAASIDTQLLERTNWFSKEFVEKMAFLYQYLYDISHVNSSSSTTDEKRRETA